MINEQPDVSHLSRKGIYQAFDAHGDVVADERWRSKDTLDGGVRIDTETVRIAPFVEARNESVSLELAQDLSPRQLIIHALAGRRESRVDIAPGRADVCWRFDDVSRNREFSWTEDCEIGYNSPLFSVATLWRRRPARGTSAQVKILRLDAVSFEPEWLAFIYTNLGEERHDTRFGPMNLTRFRVDHGTESGGSSYFWCDQTSVIFDFVASNGSGYKLVAVNFTV
jgi:hypothetical protein